MFIHGSNSKTNGNFDIKPLKSLHVEEPHSSYMLFKELPLVLAFDNTSLKIPKVLQEYSPEDVFIGFPLKIVSATLSFFFKLLYCKCVPNDEIAIYLTFRISPIKAKLTSFKILPNRFSLNNYTLLLISALGLFSF